MAFEVGRNGVDVSLRPTERLRRIATLLIWLYTLLAVALGVAVYRRVAAVDAFFANDATGDDIDGWDLIVMVVAIAQIAVLVAAAIVVALWSSRSVANAEARSGRTIGTRMAAGGWFVPIGNMWLPFVKLRAASRETGGDHRRVSHWQAGWIALIVAVQMSNLSRRVGGMGQTEQDFRDALSTEAGFVTLAAVVTAVAAFLAQRAMKAVAATTDPELTGTEGTGDLQRDATPEGITPVGSS